MVGVSLIDVIVFDTDSMFEMKKIRYCCISSTALLYSKPDRSAETEGYSLRLFF